MRYTGLSTRTKSPQRKLQEGQAIVLIGLLILVLFAMLGLAIDSGRSYVDRRDQQTAVDSAALSAGDWYENYSNLYGSTLPKSKQIYANNLHLYSAPTSDVISTTFVGPNLNLQQDTEVIQYNGGSYQLTIVATNTQFNGYQFTFTTTHQLPLAFMQIFGGPSAVTINATATAIVGNQRQTPALLTLSNGLCATHLSGSGSLTVLGDVYTNGTACVDANLHEAGNCYGATGSNCNAALYYCYNSSPGFVPYAPTPTCNSGDTVGQPVVPAPSLPDPGYLAPSQPYYSAAGVTFSRGTYSEMTPGQYGSLHLTGGAGCYFLDAGVYTWTNGYQSDGGLVSNELKAPDEELYSAPGTSSKAVSPFWAANGCEGTFNVSVVPAVPGQGMKHNGGGGNWGIEVTSVRYDRFIDPTILPATCIGAAGCRRESTPSTCKVVNTLDTNNSGIDVNITKNSPGAQYYLVYINANGCDGNPNGFSFVNRYLAPGWTDGGGPPAVAVGPYPNGANATLVNGVNGWPCGAPGVTVCNVDYNNLTSTSLCFAQSRSQLCQSPDDETKPQCFSSCPPAVGVPQDNAPMSLEYPPYTGGDIANENFCVVSPNPGDPVAPCATAKITPGAVQFYFPAGSCLQQNGGGYTHVFSGEQYNWIVIYAPPANTCAPNKLNGNALTQYIGTIYTPAASWDILGSDLSPLAGQVICYTATVTGSATAGIDFNPNYAPAPPAARLIN
jgi:Putative Flp pilus-assembly TadE/G-like